MEFFPRCINPLDIVPVTFYEIDHQSYEELCSYVEDRINESCLGIIVDTGDQQEILFNEFNRYRTHRVRIMDQMVKHSCSENIDEALIQQIMHNRQNAIISIYQQRHRRIQITYNSENRTFQVMSFGLLQNNQNL